MKIDENKVRALYSSGFSYAEIGRIYSRSRQRIHQIIKEYRNTGRQNREEKYTDFKKCAVCLKRPAEHLHHIDFDNRNDSDENLMPVCSRCHSKIHSTNTIFMDRKVSRKQRESLMAEEKIVKEKKTRGIAMGKYKDSTRTNLIEKYSSIKEAAKHSGCSYETLWRYSESGNFIKGYWWQKIES